MNSKNQLKKYHFKCLECGRKAEPSVFTLKCTFNDCNGVFDIVYDNSIQQYFPNMPIENFDRLFLGEGNTPVLNFPEYEKEFNLKGFWMKLENISPTGSFKDRGSATLINAALNESVLEFVEDSSGNAGASIAAYAAKAGMNSHIFVPKNTPQVKIDQIKVYGSKIHLIEGPRQSSTIAAQEFSKNNDLIYLSHNYSPYFCEGMKYFSYEVHENFNNEITDIVVPVGNGSLLIGCFKGYKELKSSSQIEEIPRLHCVQAENFNPIESKINNKKWISNSSNSSTIAGGIAVSEPPRKNQVVQAVLDSNGSAVSVSDENISKWHKKLAQSGVLVEPTCAAVIAGVEKLREIGELSSNSKVLVPLTGSGLKDLKSFDI